MTFLDLLSLTTVTGVLKPSTILFQSGVTTETRLVSVYHTHVPRKTRRHEISTFQHGPE